MFGLSGEHLLILGVVLLIFGPRRLPELGGALGRSIRSFKAGISGSDAPETEKLESKKSPELGSSSESASPPKNT